MRQYFRRALSLVAIMIAASGCSMTQPKSPFGALSGRNPSPAAATPAQLATHQPSAVQPPAGGYQASFASARSGPASMRFRVPKCATSG